MNPYIRPLAGLTAVAALFVMLGAGCNEPKEGQKCDNEGSYSTHSQNGHRTNLSCINGRWRKV